ncbi:MAG: hypothetical protein ACFFAH_07655 [Promethearchaeota archaeon]
MRTNNKKDGVHDYKNISKKKIYKYHDGNNNTYIIKNEGKKTIEYIPIKLHLTSSGYYDGGNHIKKEISELKYNEITSTIDQVRRNKKCHISNRVKKSGMITILKKNYKKTYILNPVSEELSKIEKILLNTIKN